MVMPYGISVNKSSSLRLYGTYVIVLYSDNNSYGSDILMESRLRIERYIGYEDFHYFKALVTNEDIMKMNMGRVFSDEEANEFFESALEINQKDIRAGLYKIYTRVSDSYIGTVVLRLDAEKASAEIEYMLLPVYWGYGYGTETVKILIDWIKEFHCINCISAITSSKNVSSKKVLIKNGFDFAKEFEVEENGSIAELYIKKLEV